MTLTGRWMTRDAALPVLPDNALDGLPKGDALSFDIAGLEGWDSGFVAFLWDIKRAGQKTGVTLRTETLPPAAARLLGLLPDQAPEPPAQAGRNPGFVEQIGDRTFAALTETGIIAELGAQAVKGGLQAVAGRGRMRMADLLADLTDAGPRALLIVGVVNFLLGAILAFVGAVQLEKFAAGIYVASLVGIAMVREMAAVMTAIIMAGRTGGAYAARISTMLGNEEIDALEVFSIPVSSYLVLPAVLSLTITMPFLYLYGCLIGMLGGFVVAIAMLDVTGAGYFHYTVTAFGIGQFLFGLSKSIVFGAFIGLTSCRIGLKAGRSAADVGVAATRAVVVGIVGVIALDALFAVIADVLNI
ncbi:MlaE family ABC transporter permease [Acidomonas methanolica]|uniref:MlaE family ABC transporter permease n=1 Tax=Acidomonas methanolica TaxID=437 RepID=UPI002119E491|nr:ABC transporter permease [Acidomonas methanolica]MCQ9154217.1 ABC transporter permease [Acidomonas methanolica]